MENDNIMVEMLKKLINIPDIPPEEFILYFMEYGMNNLDKLGELQEANEQMFKLFPQLLEGKIPLNELVLLMNPTLKEGMKYVFTKILEKRGF